MDLGQNKALLFSQGLCDVETAKKVAKRIFDLYDNDKSGAIEDYEVH